MIHLGDITKINGAEIPIVDVITGGSPCQDLSVAGKRAGLAGERSGLFMEQIRVIKEMREHDRRAGRTDEYIRPRYMVWENVPGAFSSNKGEDFRAVLEEIARVAEEDAVIPRYEKKWEGCGAVMGDGWSIAWRVHDAQFWGVPQRRKRIALVADFGGHTAPEILFERKSVFGDFEQGRTARQETAGGTGNGITDANGAISFQERAGKPGGGKGILIQNERVGALSTLNNQSVLAYGISSYDSNAMKSPNPRSDIYVADTARTLDLNGGSPACNQGGIAVVQSGGCDVYNQYVTGDVAASLTSASGGTNTSGPKILCLNDQGGSVMGVSEDVIGALRAEEHGHQPILFEPRSQARNQILRLLQENYGEEKVLKWGIAILEQLQQTDILQQGVHESIISEETEKWNELDDCALPCPELVAGWMLRDLWEQQECGCSPQGWGSTEQQFGQFAEGLPKLSQQNSQACKDLFDMWQKGEGLWLLREALSEIQKIWKSLNGQRQSVCGHSIVRRLTPLEAERLQGYPDGWTDIGEWVDSKGKKHKEADSPRYKALGNSIALPFWEWLARRIAAQYERRITLGSLFDGISGFCLVFARAGCKPVFSSEIEEYPIAVAKKHFGDDDLGLEGDYERYL